MSSNLPIRTGIGSNFEQIATEEVEGVHQLIVRESSSGPVSTIFNRFLDTVGDGSGTKNAIGDYSSGTTDFKIAPAAGEVMRLTRLLLTIGDGSLTNYYGGLLAALTNGIVVQKRNAGGVLIDLTDNVPIKINAGWGILCYDVAEHQHGGAGDEYLHGRWTFTKAGAPIRLVGDDGEFFTVRMADSMVGLALHEFVVQGFYE